MTHYSLKEYFQLILGMAAWATLYPFIKSLNGSVDPYVLALVRYGIASVLLTLLLVHSQQRGLPKQSDWPRFIALAFIGTALTTVLIALGVQHSTASASSILVNTNPLMIAILAPLLIRERTQLSQIIGVVVGIIGIVLVVLNGKHLAFSQYGVGTVLLLGSALCQALYAMYMKPLVKTYGSLVTTTAMAVAGFLELVVITILMGNIGQILMLTGQQWILLALIGTLSTAVASFIWIHSLGKLSATASTSFKLLIPVFATLYGIFFLGEQLTAWIVGGMLFTTVGILLAQPKLFNKTPLSFLT